ncbi:MAG: PH domain-containing protein [Wenzhouxiangella sp.]
MKPLEPEWQRLSGLALVFIIANSVQKTIRENLFLFAGAGAGAAFTDWLGLREFALLILLFLLLSMLGGMIYHRRFRFCLEDDAVRVRRGLIEQKELRVRFARVQNIQIGEPFYYRPFGLVRFSLQTPGAAEKEVELPGISRELALTMRDRISQQRGQPEAVPDLETESVPADLLYRAGAGRLFLHGLSSNQVWVLAGLFFYFGGMLMDRWSDRFDEAMENAASTLEWAWWWGPSLVFAILVVLFAVSGVLAILRFYGYSLRDLQDRIVAVAGLLDRREQTVRRQKITGLLLRQSAVGQLLGCWTLTVHQTQSGELDVEGGKSAFMLPGLRRSDLALTASLMSRAEVPLAFNGVSARFRQFAWSRLLFALVLLLGVLGLLLGPYHAALLLLAGASAIALPLLHWRFRRWGWWCDDERLWVRRGLLGQRIDVFELDRVQQAAVTTSPYLRRHDLATLHLVLPHGPIHVPFLPQSAAVDLANRALYAAETAKAHQV